MSDFPEVGSTWWDTKPSTGPVRIKHKRHVVEVETAVEGQLVRGLGFWQDQAEDGSWDDAHWPPGRWPCRIRWQDFKRRFKRV